MAQVATRRSVLLIFGKNRQNKKSEGIRRFGGARWKKESVWKESLYRNYRTTARSMEICVVYDMTKFAAENWLEL